MKKLLASVVITAAVVTGAIGATGAFFSDKETSKDNIFRAGSIDLKIDNESYYNGVASPLTTWTLADLDDGNGPSQGAYLFFNFPDLKPGDKGEDTISLHVDDNDSWACMTVNLTKNDDNTCNEPELLDDPTCSEPNVDLLDGELAQNVNFVWWGDDGDNALETGEEVFKEGSASAIFNGDSWTLADSSGNIWGGEDPLPGGVTKYIGKAWCFGELTLSPLAPGANSPLLPSTGGVLCNGSALNNASQTDIMMADVSFEAVQSRHNEEFLCGEDTRPCEEIFASSSAFNNQGLRRDGSAVLANRSVPSSMFGAPQTTGAPSDVGFPAGSFFSLGFTGGNIVVGFSSPFFQNPSGPDLQVFEVTGGVYPDEKVKVEVGPTSAGPWTLVAAAAIRDEDLELPIASAQFVRLTEASNLADFPLGGFADADGYDVDAVKALCGRSTSTPTPTPGLCEKKPDVMLVLDRSGSISDSEEVTLKNAANAFINALNMSLNTAHSGQSSFANTGSLDLQLTDSSVLAHNAVNALTTNGLTNLFEGLSIADTELVSIRDRADLTSPDFVVVITDGEPNEPGSNANAQTLAAAEADDLRAHGVTVYVVGVGVTPANETYLKTQIADDAAHYFPAANFAALQAILMGIANCPQ